MKLELDLQSPYQKDGSPRQDLPTGEVLAWDGKEWANGSLYIYMYPVAVLPQWGQKCEVRLIGKLDLVVLSNVLRFAPLPTIIEEDGNEAL